MKGKLLRNEDLKNYDGRVVYVEFNVNPYELTCCGDWDEHVKRCDEMRKEYKDGLFKFELEEVKELLGKPWVSGSLQRVDAEDEVGCDLRHNFIDKIYEWIETEAKEQILVWGNPREDFKRLGVKAKRKWKGKGQDKGEMLSVYEVTEDDLRILCTEQYTPNTWIDCKWRWCEGSVLEAPNDKLIINKATITAWRKQPRQKSYKDLLKYFGEELGAVRYVDIYALAIDLARNNDMTLAQLFNKYQSR